MVVAGREVGLATSVHTGGRPGPVDHQGGEPFDARLR